MSNKKTDIAVVGIACRFPGQSISLEKFWDLLINGRDGIQEIPSNHFNVRAYYNSSEEVNKINSPFAGCLENIDRFDADFFKITPTEAVMMDPQQRLALEACWEAFENACISPKSLRKTDTSFFVGSSGSDYFRLMEKYGVEEDFNLYLSTGNANSAISGHLSYFYGTCGQSATIDTACSSSLVAIHHACQELRLGNSRISVAVGVNIILDPLLNVCFSKAQMLSKDGRCKTFDAEANGYVRSEGCGVLVLKRLEDALADGDTIQAIIKGSSVNQDGASNGFTAPNPLAQMSLYEQALQDANLINTDIGYIETHGTGTKLGDPIEMKSISAVYGKNRDEGNPLYIGAVKSNIGHLEAAAGIAGVIKTILILQHKAITPNLHLKTLNPLIDLKRCQGCIPTTVIPWTSDNKPRRAAVSAFGFSGTNAHVILEEATSLRCEPHEVANPPYHVVLLSAKSEQSLHNKIKQLHTYLQESPDVRLTDIAYTLACGRDHFDKRVAYVVQNKDDLLRQLEENIAISSSSNNRIGVGFLFTGQGSQYPKMALGLYESSPLFKAHFDQCVDALKPYLKEDIFELLAQEPSQLHQTRFTQPLLWAIEVALAKMWMDLGVHPQALIGHSVGEYAAAVISDVLTLDEAAKLIVARGQLMYDLPSGGGMLVLTGAINNFDPVLEQYKDKVQIAAKNTPNQMVLAGENEILSHVSIKAKELKLNAQKLDVSHAFHSVLMAPMLHPFANYFTEIPARKPTIPFFSTLTGQQIKEPLDSSYWTRHVRETVQFAQGFTAFEQSGINFFMEIGPRPILLSFADQIIDKTVANLTSLKPKANDFIVHCEGLKKLYLSGVDIDWIKFYGFYDPAFIKFPTYPFEQRSYWANSFREHLNQEAPGFSPVIDTPKQPDLTTLPILDAERIHERIIYNLRKTMGLQDTDSLDPEANFLDMGIDSLMAVQFRNHLQAEISLYRDDIKLPGTLIFNYPNIQKVCTYIQELFEKPILDAQLTHNEIGNDAHNDDIAVIGIACRFPGENYDPEQFFDFLKSGTDGVVEVPESRTHYRNYCYATGDKEPSITSSYGGFLTNIDHFDPGFFRISPREAELMDPQHRILIETCWNAIESACLDADNLKGQPVGLFVGIGSADYATLLFKHSQEFEVNPYYATGNAVSMAAGHISYIFGWEGPSISIDTSCSSSLVAIHQATQSLRTRESEVVFAGGVNLVLLPDLSISLSRAQMLSEDGRCKTFDESANGYVRSEGCGIVVLKRLTDAQRDGNRILAVIKGSAVNQDGASNGLTAPNGLAQEKLYKQALKVSKLKETDINYIEAHGTGTKLGDPIEMSSIASVYGKGRMADNPLWIGSVKSNIGHMEAAAGIGSFIKAVLSLHFEELTPNLHLKTLNPLIDLSSAQARIITEVTPWKRTSVPRRVGVNSFGFSGTNAHIVLEESPPKHLSEQQQPYFLIVLSAKTKDALDLKMTLLENYLRIKNISNLGDISYTLACGRTHFDERVAFLVKTIDDLFMCLNEKKQIPLPQSDKQIEIYETLKKCYLDKQLIDWNSIYSVQTHSFVELPLYPFANKSYWAEPLEKLYNQTALVDDVTSYAFLSQWQEYQDNGAEQNTQDKQFIVLGEEGDFQNRIKKMLKTRGHNVVACPINKEALSKKLRDNINILYVIPEVHDEITSDVLSYVHHVLIQQVLDLIHATVDRDLRDIRFWWVIQEDNDLVTAPLVGIYRSLGLEYPRLEATLLHLNNQELPIEFFNLPQGEYRYDAGIFYQPTLANYPKLENSSSLHIAPEKSYMITGGLGGIGQELIKYLVHNGAKHIITLSRSPLNEDQKVFVEEMNNQGTTIHAIQGDVSNEKSLNLALEKIDALKIPVGGVVHAAGVLDDGVLMHQNMDRFQSVMKPKVIGTWNLMLWAKDKDLDFIVLFSSIAGLLGSQGQANYAAANAFLDVIPKYFSTLPITTVSWGPWPIGMAKNLKDFHASLGASMPSVEIALDLMGKMVANKVSNIAIADLIPKILLQKFPQRKSLLSPLLKASLDIQSLGNEVIETENFTPVAFKKWLLTQVATTLKISEQEISETKDFFEYGIDSLFIMEMQSKIDQHYGCYVPMSVFMQNPTIETLTEYLNGNLMTQNGETNTPNLILLNNHNTCTVEAEKDVPNAIFLIHPASGNTLCYRELSGFLGTDKPIYAIEQTAFSSENSTKSLNDLARIYLEQIKIIQPHGPYTLIGWSMGGVIAHEMAYLLEAEREEIAFLGLFDSYSAIQPAANHTLKSLSELRRYFLEELAHIFQVKIKMCQDEPSFDANSKEIDEIVALCAQSPFFLSNGDPNAMKQVLIQCFDNINLLAQHVPSTINADIHFLQAMEKPDYADSIAFSHEEHIQQWIKTTRGTIHQSQVPGNHYSILYNPNVSVLADYLRRYIWDY